MFWETELDPIHIEKQQILDQRSLPLTVNPAIPSKEYNLDEKKALQWIEACEGEYKFLAEKLYESIQHLTFEHLQKELSKCETDFNASLKTDHVSEYAIGLTIGKSLQWVASIAAPFQIVEFWKFPQAQTFLISPYSKVACSFPRYIIKGIFSSPFCNSWN